MQISLQEHREEVREKMQAEKDEEELLKLSFSRQELKEELEWKEEREFLYRGSMYDVLDMEKDGKRFLLTVMKDEEETKMKERFRTLRRGSAGNEDQGNSSGSRNVQPFKYLRTGGELFLSLRTPQKLYPKLLLSAPERVTLDVPIPPPC